MPTNPIDNITVTLQCANNIQMLKQIMKPYCIFFHGERAEHQYIDSPMLVNRLDLYQQLNRFHGMIVQSNRKQSHQLFFDRNVSYNERYMLYSLVARRDVVYSKVEDNEDGLDLVKLSFNAPPQRGFKRLHSSVKFKSEWRYRHLRDKWPPLQLMLRGTKVLKITPDKHNFYEQWKARTRTFLQPKPNDIREKTPTRSQLHAINAILSLLDDDDDESPNANRLITLNAFAGCGKTTCANYIIRHVESQHGKFSVLALGPTKQIAAGLIGGKTIDSVLMKRMGYSYNCWLDLKRELSIVPWLATNGSSLRSKEQPHPNLKLIVIDEFTLTVPNIIVMVRLLYPQVSILLCGDVTQNRAITSATDNNMRIIELSTHILTLGKHCRTNDPKLLRVLNRYESNFGDEYSFTNVNAALFAETFSCSNVIEFADIFITDNICRTDFAFIASSNLSTYINMLRIAKVYESYPKMRVKFVARYVQYKESTSTLFRIVPLIVGMVYRILSDVMVFRVDPRRSGNNVSEKIDGKRKMIKGEFVSIVNVEHAPDYIVVREEDVDGGETTEYLLPPQPFQESHSVEELDQPKSTTNYRGFPIEPVYARNSFNVQGATITGRVFIDFSNMSTQGQYVALSRATNSNKIKIINYYARVFY